MLQRYFFTYLFLLFIGVNSSIMWSQTSTCTSRDFDPATCSNPSQNEARNVFSFSNPLDRNYNRAAAGDTFYVRSNTGNPWGSTTNQASMDLAFGAGNWTEEYFETLDPLVVFNPSVRFVFMDGSDGGALAMNTFLMANLPAMEAWVSAGGSLFMNAAPNTGSNMNFGFGGSTLYYDTWPSSVTVIATGHPAFVGPNLPTTPVMTGGSYAHARIFGTGFTVLIEETGVPLNWVLVEKTWGAGKVVMGGMTTTDFHSPSLDSANYRTNLLVYLEAMAVVCTDLPVATCKNFTVQLDAAGNASILASDIDNGSVANCGIASMTVSPSTFTCANVGANTVTLTLTDTNGAIVTCNATVTVQDNVPPNVVTQNITAPLDATGQVTVAVGAVISSSTDACGVATVSFGGSGIAFAEVNENQSLTIALPAGSVVTSVDFASYGTPTGSNGMYSIGTCHAANSIAVVEGYALGNNSFTIPATNGVFGDPCVGTVKRLYVTVSYSIPEITFTCADKGPNTVPIFVTDVNGNTTAASAIVTVVDLIPPVIACPANIVVPAAAGLCSAVVTYTAPVGTDNCPGATTALLSGLASGSAFPAGINVVTYRVIDAVGNTTDCSFNVTVQDLIPPTAICKPLTVQLNASGTVTITSAQIDNGSTDACGIASYAVSPSTFTCANVGNNNVTLTVTDNNGNVATCTSIVTVQDVTLPVALCQNITVPLDASGVVTIVAAQVNNGSNDACGIFFVGLDKTEFNCSNIGANTVTLGVIDNSFNFFIMYRYSYHRRYYCTYSDMPTSNHPVRCIWKCQYYGSSD